MNSSAVTGRDDVGNFMDHALFDPRNNDTHVYECGFGAGVGCTGAGGGVAPRRHAADVAPSVRQSLIHDTPTPRRKDWAMVLILLFAYMTTVGIPCFAFADGHGDQPGGGDHIGVEGGDVGAECVGRRRTTRRRRARGARGRSRHRGARRLFRRDEDARGAPGGAAVAAVSAAGYGSTGPSTRSDGLSSGSGLRKLDAAEGSGSPMWRHQSLPLIKGAIEMKGITDQPMTEQFMARMRLDAGAGRGGHRESEAPG